MPGTEDFTNEDFFNEEDFAEEIDTEEGAADGAAGEGETDPVGGEPAGDVGDGTPGGDPASEEGSDGNDGTDGKQGGFSPEMQAAIEAETQRRIDARIAEQYKGKINPYNGKPITSEADLNAYMAAYNADMQRQQLQEMGIDQKQLNEIVGNLPEVQQAKMMLAQQQQEQANKFMRDQFDAMKKEYPDCGFADVAAMMNDPDGLKVLEFWRDSPNLTIADAYLLKNKDKIRAQQNAAAKQGAMNQMNSKSHLKQTKGSNAKGEIPADVVEGYRIYYPKATMEEIAEMYRKNHEND